MKTRIIGFIVCFIIISSILTVEGNLNIEKYNEIKSKTKNNYDLEITNIQGGIGLNFSIINIGCKDITNIVIKLNIVGGGIVLPRIKKFEISLLSIGESQQLKINIFGIGLGNLFKFLKRLKNRK